MKKMAVTWVDKNEFFLTKRTHNPNSYITSSYSTRIWAEDQWLIPEIEPEYNSFTRL